MEDNAVLFLPESLTLAVEEIDEQHGALFAELADIKAICLASNVLPIAQAQELISSLHIHFATEEQLAAAVQYDFSDHAVKHAKMVRAIEKGLAEVLDGTQDVFSLLRYVEYWFERHISEEDRPLGLFLNQQRN